MEFQRMETFQTFRIITEAFIQWLGFQMDFERWRRFHHETIERKNPK